jgi:hypothetical protein
MDEDLAGGGPITLRGISLANRAQREMPWVNARKDLAGGRATARPGLAN